MMLSYPLTQEVSAALTALGDQLSAHQWIDAAHAWWVKMAILSTFVFKGPLL